MQDGVLLISMCLFFLTAEIFRQLGLHITRYKMYTAYNNADSPECDSN